MLLVDADQAEPRQRGEDRRARTDHDRRVPRGDALALVAPLRLAERRVEDRHAVAEACPEAADRLWRERDLGDEDDHAEVAGERLGRGLQVDLGLPAAGRAVEQEVAAALVVRAPEPGQRTLLGGGQRLRLRLASQGVAFGGLRQLLAARALRRGDERERPARRRAVVVREPERELDERRGQRLDDALDRSSLDALPGASPRARSRPRVDEPRRA